MTRQPLDNILSFAPHYKQVLWGGTRIPQLKGEPCDLPDIGESWEISGLQDHESTVDSGTQKGLTINRLARLYGSELLGSEVERRYGRHFPLLVKLIDADDILSLQVHPQDAPGTPADRIRGKSEMWYVIDAAPGARIFCGLSAPLTPGGFMKHVGQNTVMDAVASYASRPGQFYFIPSGTIHSIGGGNLIVEVQQSSDITYRVYDHGRTASDGSPRPLHIDQAREAIDYTFPRTIEPTARTFAGTTHGAVACEHFTIDLYNLAGPSQTETIESDHRSFRVLLVTDGSVTVDADGVTRRLTAGHTVLIPARVGRITLSGSGTVLSTHA